MSPSERLQAAFERSHAAGSAKCRVGDFVGEIDFSGPSSEWRPAADAPEGLVQAIRHVRQRAFVAVDAGWQEFVSAAPLDFRTGLGFLEPPLAPLCKPEWTISEHAQSDGLSRFRAVGPEVAVGASEGADPIAVFQETTDFELDRDGRFARIARTWSATPPPGASNPTDNVFYIYDYGIPVSIELPPDASIQEVIREADLDFQS